MCPCRAQLTLIEVVNENEADAPQLSYVTAQLNSFKPDAGTDHFLVCGNPNMINDVYGLLKQKGFKAKQVVREKYVFARQEKVTGKVSLTEAQKKLIAEKLRKYR